MSQEEGNGMLKQLSWQYEIRQALIRTRHRKHDPRDQELHLRSMLQQLEIASMLKPWLKVPPTFPNQRLKKHFHVSSESCFQPRRFPFFNRLRKLQSLVVYRLCGVVLQ